MLIKNSKIVEKKSQVLSYRCKIDDTRYMPWYNVISFIKKQFKVLTVDIFKNSFGISTVKYRRRDALKQVPFVKMCFKVKTRKSG